MVIVSPAALMSEAFMDISPAPSSAAFLYALSEGEAPKPLPLIVTVPLLKSAVTDETDGFASDASPLNALKSSLPPVEH